VCFRFSLNRGGQLRRSRFVGNPAAMQHANPHALGLVGGFPGGRGNVANAQSNAAAQAQGNGGWGSADALAGAGAQAGDGLGGAGAFAQAGAQGSGLLGLNDVEAQARARVKVLPNGRVMAQARSKATGFIL
jgi:hypothetical protein